MGIPELMGGFEWQVGGYQNEKMVFFGQPPS